MKVGIVGAGLVGSTSAYALVLNGVCSEITLVDKNTLRAEAEADDILHAVPFAQRVRVKAGDYSDLKNSRVVVVGAGVNQKPGETRLQLLQRNAAVFAEVVPNILRNAPDAILLVVTNPVDVMTHLAAVYAAEYGVKPNRVIGSGTTLDTARFRSLIGRRFGVDPQHVHGYVIGEHGDSEVLTWSNLTIAGAPILEFCDIVGVRLDAESRREIDAGVRRAAYRIIEGKGATYYGIGAAVSHIVDVITHDYRAILTLSTRTEEVAGVADVTISLPRLLGGEGVITTLTPPLAPDEEEALKRSAELVRRASDEVPGTTEDRRIEQPHGLTDFGRLSRKIDDDIQPRGGAV
jgi:L-lactate dehydrogenase